MMTTELQGKICLTLNQLAEKHGDKPIARKVTYGDQHVVEASFYVDGGGCAAVPATFRAENWPQAYGISYLYLKHKHEELLSHA